MADLHVNDPKVPSIDKSIFHVGERCFHIKNFFFLHQVACQMGTANLYEEEAKREGGKEDLDSIKAPCLSPTYLIFFSSSSSSSSFQCDRGHPPLNKLVTFKSH